LFSITYAFSRRRAWLYQAPPFHFDAFSSREPGPTLLENAMK
jgi:hypothetical protein